MIAGILAAVLPGLLCLSSCQQPFSSGVSESLIQGQRLSISLQTESPDDPLAVRSSFTASDQAVVDCNLLLFEGGTLVAKYYQASDADFSVEVVADRSYDCYCIANVGNVTDAFTLGVTTVSQMASWRVEPRVSGAVALPMAWNRSGIAFTKAQLTSGARLEIELRRLVAQYDLQIDRSGLSLYSFTATGLSVCGASSVAPFSESSKGTAQAVRTDYALAGDLILLNSGRKSTYYPLENCYGTLLTTTDSWQKVPDRLRAGEFPTYLELTGFAVLEDGSGVSVPLTCRFYLGRNATNDFDVRRNEVYTVTLLLTDEALEREEASWKIEKGSYTDTRSLAFADEVLSVYPGWQAEETVLREPANLKYILLLDPELEAAGVRVSGVVPGEPTDRNSLTFSAPAGRILPDGKAFIRTLDGKLTDELILRCTPPLEELTVLEAEVRLLTKGETHQFAAQARYADGTTRDVTAEAVWRVGDPEMLTVDKGLVTTKMKTGTASVDVSFTEGGVTLTASGSVTVTKRLTGLEVTPVLVYLPDTGEERIDPINIYDKVAIANVHHFSLVATYHDGSTEDVTDMDDLVTWKGDMVYRYRGDDGYWHLISARREKDYQHQSDQMVFSIYRGASKDLVARFWMGPERYILENIDIIQPGQQVPILIATYVFEGETMEVTIMGTIDPADMQPSLP